MLAKFLKPLLYQEDLKRKLVSAFSQYTLYLDRPAVGRPLVLVMGPSGCGKTFAIELLCQGTGLPYSIFSAGAISPPGYRGTTVKDVLQEVLLKRVRDGLPDCGVIVIDEVDKWTIGALKAAPGTEAAAAGNHCQAEVLRYVEREIITFADEAKDDERLEDQKLDTSRYLWVLAGAFTGIEHRVKERLHNYSDGFKLEDALRNLIPEDAVNYGMLNELANRIRVWAWVEPLKRTALREILMEQEVPAWEQRFKAIGCKLTIDPGALGRCGDAAYELGTGVRGAKAMLDRPLNDLFYEASLAGLRRLHVDVGMVLTGKIEHVLSA